MRCLALAQAWQDAGGQVRFAMASHDSALRARLNREGIVVQDIIAERGSSGDVGETVEVARQSGASWIVADGYWVGSNYQRAVRVAGFSLLVVDDSGGPGPWEANLVLNQNFHAAEGMYAIRRSETTLLLGSRFALLRREFQPWRGFSRETPRVPHVLVTMGGSDPQNETARAIRALGRFRDACELRILVGPANPFAADIRAEAERSSLTDNILWGVDDLPALLAWSDMAVTAAGSTCWELAFMGVPMITIAVADNQRPIGEGLAAAGAARHLGWHESLDDEKLVSSVAALLDDRASRRRMSDAGRHLVDGRGAERVVECLGAARAA